MREKQLLQFICKIQPKNILIPAQVYFDEAYYQRDQYRGKLRDYYANQRDKKLLPSGLPKDYIQPIMQNLERRSERPLQKRADGSYLYPQPAYLVLAAWSFILFTDAHIDKFFEGNFRVEIKNYLDMCTSIPGLRDALTQAIDDYKAASTPSLFDIPPIAPKAPQSPLPEYGHSQKNFNKNANINISAPDNTIIFQDRRENIQINEQDMQPSSRSPQPSAAVLYPFMKCKDKAEEVIGLLRRYMDGKNRNKPKDIMMPVRAALDARVIRKPTYTEFKAAFPEFVPRAKSSFDDYLKIEKFENQHPYYGVGAFLDMVSEFEQLKKESGIG